MTVFSGQVVSTKNIDTAIVVAKRRARHPLYGKSITKSKRYPVHDKLGAKVGDTVHFKPCSPKSKTKRWEIIKIVNDKENKDKKKNQRQK